MNLLLAFFYSQYILAGILVVLFTITLIKVKRGSNYKFVTGLLILLIAYNLAFIGQVVMS